MASKQRQQFLKRHRILDPIDERPNKSSVSFALSDGGADTTITVGPSGDLKVGYSTVNVESGSSPYGTAVFSLVQYNVVVSEVGVPASTATTSARIFVDFRSSALAVPGDPNAGRLFINTGLALVNPGSTTASLTYTLRGTDGRRVPGISAKTADWKARKSDCGE